VHGLVGWQVSVFYVKDAAIAHANLLKPVTYGNTARGDVIRINHNLYTLHAEALERDLANQCHSTRSNSAGAMLREREVGEVCSAMSKESNFAPAE